MKLAVVSITNRCNFKCKMCDIGQKNQASSGLYPNLLGHDEIDPKQWANIFDTLKVDAVDIVGVEPLLYPRFHGLLSKIYHNRKKRIRLTTNGWHLEKWKSAIVQYVELTTVSIDGLKETHDRIRGVDGAFDRAFHGLTSLGGNNGWGKRVRTSFAITPDNVQDMIPFYELMMGNGIPVIFNHYNYIHPISCEGNKASPSNMVYDLNDIDIKQVLKAIKHCKKAAFLPRLTTEKQLDRYYRRPPTTRLKSGNGCKVLNEAAQGKRFVINSDGTLIPGNRCWITKEIGNVLDGALPENTKWIKNIAKDIKKNGFYPPCQRLCCSGKTV